MSKFLRTASLSLFKVTQFGLVVLGGIKLAEWAGWSPDAGRRAGIVLGFAGLFVPHYFRHQSMHPEAKRTPGPMS